MHVWSWEDVIHRSHEQFPDCELPTRDQAERMLKDVERHIDCELGITWITLDHYIDNFISGDYDK